ncbi:MAG: acyl-CoA thioesterase [Betaproteobacteria bacterium]
MSKTHVTSFTVEFGDCDPAGIVFYPNYLRWIDAASLHYFRAMGVPPWHELEAQTGIIGTPIVDLAVRFLRTASYGDEIDIETTIAEWRGKSFVFQHVVRRDDDILVECNEVRIFARRNPQDPKRIQAVPAPDAFVRACE